MWGRRSGENASGIERALRAHRVEPAKDFVDGVARQVAADGRRRAGRAWSRVAFASAVSVFILGSFASFGGLSYAASGATGTYHTVHQAVVKHKLVVSVHTSSAAGQYPKSVFKPPAAVKPVTHVTTHHPSSVAAQGVNAETLPFTGVSLLGTFVASLGLIGAGIFLRRRERQK
jgi:hypothetical protein